MKKYVNGKYIKMTKAEIEELKAKMPEIPAPIKTEMEERLEKLEAVFGDLKGSIDALKAFLHI
jgi:hypothetical protein